MSRHPKVISTPHTAGLTTQAQTAITQALAHDLQAVLAGERAAHAVGNHHTAQRQG